MKVKKELFPKLSKLPNGRFYVYFWYEGNRYRFYNGNVLGEKINPNLLEEPEREKTGSLQKLQQVMGHSDLKVSLTYLRGLEVKELDVEDLPEL
jgi:hypothetical protein